jgi:hypothetical protein
LTWSRRTVIAILLLVGAYEAGRLWLGCVTSLGSLDGLYGCSVRDFDIHHFNTVLLLLGAAWVLITGIRRGDNS